MKKILIGVVSSETHNHGQQLNIDRVDLTRRLDMLNTWVEDAFYSNIDVVFIVGGHDKTEYFNDSLTLKVDVDDSYEELNTQSKLFKKIQKFIIWALENKDFDYVYLCDDDVYINISELKKLDLEKDFYSNGAYGGSGFIISKKATNKIINNNEIKSYVADREIYSLMYSDNEITRGDLKRNAVFYIPAEKYVSVHYCTGKRVYNLHHTIKMYNETGRTYRKILLGYPLNNMVENNYITYESTVKRKTKRWYDFTKDPNGWEYHGGYSRSDLQINLLKTYWPYAENASKYMVIHPDYILRDYYVNKKIFYENLNYLIDMCKKSCIDENNVFLISNKNDNIDGWVIDKSLNEKLDLTFEGLKNSNVYRKI